MLVSYELGQKAHDAGKERAPLKDHDFARYIQTAGSSKHHPKSPGVNMTDTQRRELENKLLEWKRGWDNAHTA